MSPTKHTMLKRFGAFSRNEEFFLLSAPGWLAMKQATVSKYLRELFDDGLIQKVRTGYKITERGRAMVDGPGESKAPTRHVNAAMPNMDRLPHEMRSHRPGADQHQQYLSKGTLC